MDCFSIQATKLTIPMAGIEPVVVVHGGAGDIPDELIPAKIDGVKLAARVGFDTLRQTGSVLDAVQEAVCSMELNAHFNCGYGSVLTWDGKVEMEAAIMNGADLEAGCVSLARDINHPIVLARRIMQKTPHRYLAGEGAMAFAVEEGFEILAECALVTPSAFKALQDYKTSIAPRPPLVPQCCQPAPQCCQQVPQCCQPVPQCCQPVPHMFNLPLPTAAVTAGEQQACNCFPFPCAACQKNLFGGGGGCGGGSCGGGGCGGGGCGGGGCSGGGCGGGGCGGCAGGGSPGTVGAVAIDRFGNVAAATSTGGLTGKMAGRIGDSSIIGGGTYADNSAGAVSCTGHGETIMRFNVASRILAQIRLGAQPAQQAASIVLSEMVGRLNQCTAGVICVDRNGDVGIEFTARRMPWAYQRSFQMHFGVEKGEDCVEPLGPPVAAACQQSEIQCCCD